MPRLPFTTIIFSTFLINIYIYNILYSCSIHRFSHSPVLTVNCIIVTKCVRMAKCNDHIQLIDEEQKSRCVKSTQHSSGRIPYFMSGNYAYRRTTGGRNGGPPPDGREIHCFHLPHDILSFDI